MTHFTLQSTLHDMEHIPELGACAKYVMYAGVGMSAPAEVSGLPLSAVSGMGWSPEGMVNGLNLLTEQLARGAGHEFVYSEAECAEDGQKRDVNILRLVPEQSEEKKPWLLLISGGAYQMVCSGAESLPAAVHFVKRGYQVFVLTYRVGGRGVFPKPLEDVAAAIRHIRARAAEYGLDPDAYAVSGWSAGGNLTATWGVKSVGWGRYGLPKPRALFTVYPVTDLIALYETPEHREFLETMFGPDVSRETVERYDAAGHADGEYPPCYIVCGKNDATVPCAQSETLKARLDKAGVPAVLNEVPDAPHGFGDGTGTDAAGWPEAALDFLESL